MIFSEELDKSLSLILESDKKNRDKIKCFIENIPASLFQQIYDKLEEYREYESGNLDIFDLDDLCLHGEFNYYDKRFKYSFVIDLVNNSLSINKSMLINGEYKDNIELTLYMVSRYNNVDIFGRQSIGSFTNYVTKSEMEYDLINTLLGLMVEYSCYDYNRNSEGLKKYKRVNANTINGKLELSNKNSLCRVKKLN